MAGRTPHLAARRWDFIDDPMLQDILRRDYDELRRLVRRRADKSVVVLSGTIVEALLAGLLSKDKEAAIQALRRKSGNREPKPFAEWTLYPLIQAAVELKLLDGNAEIQASALKDFRNLIHPLVQERMLAVLNAGTVNTALALLVSVLDHLESQRTRAVKKGLEQWTVSRGLTPTWTATHGYLPKLYVNGEAFTLFLISSKHRLQIRFGRLRAGSSQFKIKAMREQLRQRLNQIGFNLPARAIDKLPAIPLERLTAPGMLDGFIEVLDWVVATIRSH